MPCSDKEQFVEATGRHCQCVTHLLFCFWLSAMKFDNSNTQFSQRNILLYTINIREADYTSGSNTLLSRNIEWAL